MATGANAAPWLEAGSRQLRQDVEMLVAAGLITGPSNAWPMPVAQLCQKSADALSPDVAAAQRRMRAACIAASAGGAGFDAALANDPALIRDFGGGAREPIDLSGRWVGGVGRLHLSLGAGYRVGQDGADVHLEPSYAVLDLGSWALYGGYVEPWWGPGHEQALLFSNNARPFPKLGVRRLRPRPIDLPLLRNLGPVSAEAFVGVLTEKRSDFDHPALAGVRIAFSPLPGLEIGLNRALQLCGEGRPCDGRTILDALIALGNRDNSGTPNEPGNQLAGFDLSYTRRIGSVAAQLYVEAEGEDENHFLVEQYGRLAGIGLTGPLGAAGTTWSLRAEYTNTLASKLFGTSQRYAGSFYNHFIYTEGFRYRGPAIGSSLDTDGRILTLASAVTDMHGRRFHASWRAIALNRTGRTGHGLSSNREDFSLITAGAELPTGPKGGLRLEVRVSEDELGRSGRLPVQGQIEFGWRSRL